MRYGIGGRSRSILSECYFDPVLAVLGYVVHREERCVGVLAEVLADIVTHVEGITYMVDQTLNIVSSVSAECYLILPQHTLDGNRTWPVKRSHHAI